MGINEIDGLADELGETKTKVGDKWHKIDDSTFVVTVAKIDGEMIKLVGNNGFWQDIHENTIGKSWTRIT